MWLMNTRLWPKREDWTEKSRNLGTLLLLIGIYLVPNDSTQADTPDRPNIILIMTDDQGYGDLGVHGNPIIRTPNLDRFAKQSVELKNFYVSPVCAPTRASLMTGRYNYRTGVTDTYLGRAMMYGDEVTIAESLSDAGYRTGIFGKWHLGDNYPMRPMDQGFQESLVHRGGGIGQPSDPPEGSSYFDPILQHNGKEVKTKGYCSDVYTDAAIKFLSEPSEKPFFVYLPFNCPHTPLQVKDEDHKRYAGNDFDPDKFPDQGHKLAKPNKKMQDTTARIYGMVDNIDQNIGRLLEKLDKSKLAENTIVVFLTDNGPQQARYNAGMKARKGSVYEGGIHVPCYVRWPAKLKAGTVVAQPAAHIDLMPTLLAACGVEAPTGRNLDGKNLLPLLTGKAKEIPDRNLVFQWHRGDVPEPLRACAIRNANYKLVQPLGGGHQDLPENASLELYDMQQDPLEQNDISDEKPEIVEELKQAYLDWYDSMQMERDFELPNIVIGSEAENPTHLTRQDWRGPEAGWRPRELGYWELYAEKGAKYLLTANFPPLERPATIQLKVGKTSLQAKLETGAESFRFLPFTVSRGPQQLRLELQDEKGRFGVYQAELAKVP